jgi:hypothetical protein
MSDTARKVTLWTSVNAERQGLDVVAPEVTLSPEIKEKIKNAFLKKATDSRIKTYEPSTEGVSSARMFG